MERVERHIILRDEVIDGICFKSKNLYNLANYLVRQEFINNDKWLRYKDLYEQLKDHECYNELPSHASQQVLRLLDKNWVSFFRTIKLWSKNKSKFTGRPKLPKYKHKVKGRNIVIFTNQQCRIKDGYIHFCKKANLKPLKTKVDNVQQVRIIPKATCYVIEVVYKKEVVKCEVEPDTYLSIDIGLNNFVSCVNNIGQRPFIIKGGILKSMNQYFNKKKAKLMSFIKDRGFSNRINSLTHKRNCKIDNYLHKTSRFIIDYCKEHKISTIVIGKNDNWKQNINIGKRNNQNFVSVPFLKLIQQIEYKAEEIGIEVIRVNESYTSKCSFLDNEPIKKHKTYLGKRIKRGLFKTKTGKKINADINAAYNILKKAIPDVRWDRGIGVIPITYNLNPRYTL